MFKQRKNKTFNYKSRLSQENESGFDSFESKNTDFVSKWKKGREGKAKVGLSMSIRTLILVLVLLLICMYILDSKFN